MVVDRVRRAYAYAYNMCVKSAHTASDSTRETLKLAMKEEFMQLCDVFKGLDRNASFAAEKI